MKANITGIIVQILIWVAFLAVPFLLSPETGTLSHFLHSTPMRKEIIYYLLLIGFFYLSFHLLVPKLYMRGRYLWLVVTLIAAFCITSYLPSSIITKTPDQEGPPFRSEDRPGQQPPPPRQENKPPVEGPAPENLLPDSTLRLVITKHLFTFLLVFFIALILRVNRKLRQTEKAKIVAELSYLKAQINPHFLFNTLNSIYSLAVVGSDKTAAAIVKLSQMMRYVLHESALAFVPLEKELDYIKTYIGFQEMRFADTVPVSFKVSGNADGKKIAPLILIPLIENAFKHGANAEEDSLISIEIIVASEQLTMAVFNKKVSRQADNEEKSGIGVENTVTRLKFLYPNSHHLTAIDTLKDYSVMLTLSIV